MIRLPKPVAGLRVIEEPARTPLPPTSPQPTEGGRKGLEAGQADLPALDEAIGQQTDALVQLAGTINTLAARLNDLHQQTVVRHRSDIARLAVEIARKILKQNIDNGQYNIQTIIEETLKRVPTRQKLVVRLNPEDLGTCERFQRENPDSQFAELDFVPDWAVARADCLVETPKGIVKSFVEDHLTRIGEALERAQ